MSLTYRFDKLMKKIGAYTIPDDVIELAEVYRSLPREQRRLLDSLDAGLSLEDAAERLKLDVNQAEAMLARIDELAGLSENDHPPDQDDPAPERTPVIANGVGPEVPGSRPDA
jgi:hypothetical protein